MFLATTAITDFWDFESKLLLLGPWCLANKNNRQIKKDYFLIPSPWKPTNKIKEAADYCYQIYKELLPLVSKELNRIHDVSYPLRYWQILIGPWLLYFTIVLYDRYKRLENAVTLFPNLYTHALPLHLCDATSIDTYDFIGGKIDDDFYNFKLFSIIGHELIPRNITEIHITSDTKTCRSNYRPNMKFKIFNFFMKSMFSKGRIMLSDMYHLKNIDRLLIKLKSGGGEIGFIDFFDKNDLFLNQTSFNEKLRGSIKFREAKDNFQQLLYRVIPSAMPTCYLEGFKNYSNYIDSFKEIVKMKFLGSAVGWFFNEPLKFFAAKATLSNTKLIEFQHGGGYEVFLPKLIDAVALEKDLFYAWGTSSLNNEKTSSGSL